MSHFLLVTLHLLAAIAFAGTVFVEVVFLQPLSAQVGHEPMRALERAFGRRARRIMPFVFLLLYGAGITMAWGWRESLAHPFADSFATLLWLKILLALSVLGHFVTAVSLGARGRLRARASRIIHLSVFAHVLLIVILAKAIFYLTW